LWELKPFALEGGSNNPPKSNHASSSFFTCNSKVNFRTLREEEEMYYKIWKRKLQSKKNLLGIKKFALEV
jgi:hypothetical protein